MKKYIILFILLFGAGIAISDIDTFEGTATDSLSDIEGSTVAAGASCTDLDALDCSNCDYDTVGASGYGSQKIKYESGCTIGSAVVELAHAGTAVNVHLEAWTTADESGAQIGGDSDTQLVDSNQYNNFETFTWASNKPTPSSDYFLHVKNEDGSNNLLIIYDTDENTYEDTNYDYYTSTGTEVTGDVDLSFQVNYE
jgi:hypothetical protein